jgi:hypothetical protein
MGERTGWKCPSCDRINSPDVKSCHCTKCNCKTKKESTTEDTKQLLNE